MDIARYLIFRAKCVMNDIVIVCNATDDDDFNIEYHELLIEKKSITLNNYYIHINMYFATIIFQK